MDNEVKAMCEGIRQTADQELELLAYSDSTGKLAAVFRSADDKAVIATCEENKLQSLIIPMSLLVRSAAASIDEQQLQGQGIEKARALAKQCMKALAPSAADA